jgi:hypothetical protein
MPTVNQSRGEPSALVSRNRQAQPQRLQPSEFVALWSSKKTRSAALESTMQPPK